MIAEICSLAAPWPIIVVVLISIRDNPSNKICFLFETFDLLSIKNQAASKTTVIAILIIHIEPNDVCNTTEADAWRRNVCTTSIKMFDAKTKNKPIPIIEENLA